MQKRGLYFLGYAPQKTQLTLKIISTCQYLGLVWHVSLRLLTYQSRSPFPLSCFESLSLFDAFKTGRLSTTFLLLQDLPWRASIGALHFCLEGTVNVTHNFNIQKTKEKNIDTIAV